MVSVIISEERQRGRGKLCSQAGWQSGGDTFKPRGLAIWTEISKTPIASSQTKAWNGWNCQETGLNASMIRK